STGGEAQGGSPPVRSSGHPALDLFDEGRRVLPDGCDVEAGDPCGTEGLHTFAHVGFGTDHVGQFHEFLGDSGGGLVLLAVQVQVLDLLGGLLVAVTAGHRVVEVLALGTHAADIQRDHGAHEVEEFLGVLALTDGEHPPGGDLQVPEFGVTPGLALGKGVAPHQVGLFGDEQVRQPTVGDLGGHGDVLHTQGGDVDRDPGSYRVV